MKEKYYASEVGKYVCTLRSHVSSNILEIWILETENQIWEPEIFMLFERGCDCGFSAKEFLDLCPAQPSKSGQTSNEKYRLQDHKKLGISEMFHFQRTV